MRHIEAIYSLISFQSRIFIYRPKFFYIRFILHLLMQKGKDLTQTDLKKDLEKIYSDRKVCLTNQGRDAIYFAVKYSIKITGKREIIVSPYTLYHVINMIIFAGGIPVFIDLEKNCLHCNLKSIKSKVGRNTASVLITHLSYVNPEIEKIKKFTQRNGLLLIEDCAVALGSKSKDLKPAGFYGDMAILSFQAMKNLQSIYGGAIILKDIEAHRWISNQIKDIKEIEKLTLVQKTVFIFLVDLLTRTKFINFIFFSLLRYSYKNDVGIIIRQIRADHYPTLPNTIPNNCLKKLSNTQAKFIKDGLKSLNSNQNIRSQLAKIYFKGLKKIKQVSLLFTETVEQSNFLELPITCEMRDDLFVYLLDHNIDVRKFYYRNLAEVDDYRTFGNRCPNARFIEKHILTLPCYPGFKKSNAERIVEKINDFYRFQSQHKDV